MLDFKQEEAGDSMEETFGCTFQIKYNNMFDDALHHDLMSGGADVPVTETNCRVRCRVKGGK